MVQRGVTGAVPFGSVGPKIATTGRPTAEATCMAPESLPMKRWHCESKRRKIGDGSFSGEIDGRAAHAGSDGRRHRNFGGCAEQDDVGIGLTD